MKVNAKGGLSNACPFHFLGRKTTMSFEFIAGAFIAIVLCAIIARKYYKKGS